MRYSKLYEKIWEKKYFFASLKSMTKGVGSVSVSQRIRVRIRGFIRIRIRTKMSWILNTVYYYLGGGQHAITAVDKEVWIPGKVPRPSLTTRPYTHQLRLIHPLWNKMHHFRLTRFPWNSYMDRTLWSMYVPQGLLLHYPVWYLVLLKSIQKTRNRSFTNNRHVTGSLL